jgi:hypothetical protein
MINIGRLTKPLQTHTFFVDVHLEWIKSSIARLYTYSLQSNKDEISYIKSPAQSANCDHSKGWVKKNVQASHLITIDSQKIQTASDPTRD